MAKNTTTTTTTYNTKAEASKALHAKVAELNAALKAKSIEQITIKADAEAIAAECVRLACLEYIGSVLCANPAPVEVFNAYVGHRRVNIAECAVKPVKDKDTDKILSYAVGGKDNHMIDFPALCNYWAEHHANKDGNPASLTNKANYEKYFEMFLYTATAYNRVKDGKMDWSIPTMSARGQDIYNDLLLSERKLSNKEKVWTGTANRDHFDAQVNALVNAIFPAEFGKPSLRAEDRKYILDSIVFTVPGSKRYGRIEPVNLYRVFFDAIEQAKDNAQWRVFVGENATYDGGFSAKESVAKADKAAAAKDSGKTPTKRKEAARKQDAAPAPAEK